MSSVIDYNPLRRNPWFQDKDGAQARVKASADEVQVIWDLTDHLASGETVSSAAYADSGITTSSKSVATPRITFTATGLGETVVTATLSTGRTVERTYRFFGPSGATGPSDYR